MKKAIVLKLIIFPAIIICLLFSGNVNADDGTLIIENRYLQLEMERDTTEFRVLDKKSGDVWYSNPPARDEVDTIASGTALEELNSLVEITYYTPGNHRRFMNSYADSVVFDQFEIVEIEDGIRVEYTIGQEWRDDDYIPFMMSRERFESFLANLEDEADREFLLDQYHLITLEHMPEGYEREGVYNVDKEEVFGDYTLVDVEREELTDREKRNLLNRMLTIYEENREEYSGVGDVTALDINFMKENEVYMLKDNIPRWFMDDIAELMEQSGVHPFDIQESNLEVHLDPPLPNITRFFIPVEFRLAGPEFEVSVSGEEIEYPRDVYSQDYEREVQFPLYSISLLKFFGAGGPDDEGYLVVPEGSGGLINFNNGEIRSPAYDSRVYGYDYAIRPREEKPPKTEQIHFPVYGVKHEEQAFLAVVEEGDAISRIRADVAGRTNSYNFVYNNFNTMPMATIILEREDASDTRMNVYQSRIYEGEMKIGYRFLSGENANYTGMAHSFQDYLQEREILAVETEDRKTEQLPFFLDVQGVIHQRRPFMGVPRDIPISMTTFTETEEMVSDFLEADIDNLNVRYLGWLKGGEEHYYPSGVDIEKRAGTREELLELNNLLTERGIDFYPEVNFFLNEKNKLLDGFIAVTHGSRFLNNRTAELYEYNTAVKDTIAGEIDYPISPRRIPGLMGNFMSDFEELELSALSLKYAGEFLYSDFRRNPERLIDRGNARDIVIEEIDQLRGNYDLDLVVDGGNLYTLPYVNNVFNMPLFTTGYNMIDRGIPFMQIALHGFIDYAGEPINLADSPWRTKLKSIEYGARPYFMGSYAPSSKVKYTTFDDKYYLHYGDWFTEAIDFYNELNSVMGEVYTERITEHRKIADNVFLTVYGEQLQVIVNYNEKPVTVEGMEVPATDYIIIQGDVKGDVE